MSVTQIIVMGGMGRMGSTLTHLALNDPELELVAVLERPEKEKELRSCECGSCMIGSNKADLLPKVPGGVIVDFTSPEATMDTVVHARKFGNPIVIGTTGLTNEQQAELKEAAQDIPIFWAPNMSVGVNVLLAMLPRLSEMLGTAYDTEIVEIHHKHKKDAPSGTAVKLAQVLSQSRGWDPEKTVRACREGIIGARPEEELGVQTLRGGDVVGDHTVYFLGPGERIEVTHRAHSRETFAQGALRAAKWLAHQETGTLYSMADMVSE